MSSVKGNKHYTAHKITNIFYLIIFIPFLILGFLSVMSMYSTKLAGGHANLFGYYVVGMPDDNWYWDVNENPNNPSNHQMGQKWGKYKPGNLFLFKVVNPENLEEGDRVLAFYNPDGDQIGGSYPSWEPLNITMSATNYSSENKKSGIRVVEIAGEKAVVEDENGNEHVCFSYYGNLIASSMEIPSTTSRMLVAEDIIGVEVAPNQFLMSAILFLSSFNGFLTLVLIPIVCLIILKLVSLICYKKYLSTVDFTQKAQIIGSGQNVSYAKVVQGVRQGKTPETQRGQGAPQMQGLRQTTTARPQATARPAQTQRTQTTASVQPQAKTTVRTQTTAKPAQVQQPRVATRTQANPAVRQTTARTAQTTKTAKPQSEKAIKKQQQKEGKKVVSTRLANKK